MWLAAYKYPSFCHGVPSLLPPGTLPLPPAPSFLDFFELRLAVNVDVVKLTLGLFWELLATILETFVNSGSVRR